MLERNQRRVQSKNERGVVCGLVSRGLSLRIERKRRRVRTKNGNGCGVRLCAARVESSVSNTSRTAHGQERKWNNEELKVGT